MQRIVIAGREMELLLTVAALEEIDARFGSYEQMVERMRDRRTYAKAMCGAIAALGNGALQYRGKEPDISEKWVCRHVAPGELAELDKAVAEAFSEGWRMEAESGERPQDVVLEEMEAQKKTGA